MFSRNTELEKPEPASTSETPPKPLQQFLDRPAEGNGAPPPPSNRRADDQRRTAPRNDGVSVIGRDLAILGNDLKIVSHGVIQIEGEIRGDVYGREIVIGDDGQVNGVVAADSIVVRGTVKGMVKGRDVTLTSTAKVNADVHHATLSLEQGALFEGRCRRPEDVASLSPDLEKLAAEPEADSTKTG